MSVLGDFDMKTVQPIFSSREMFKRTIVEHDFIFREQVVELHRLCSIQKTLMRDLGSNCANSHSWRANTQFPAHEIKYASDPTFKVGSIPPRTSAWFDECKSPDEPQEQSLHFQLSPDELVGHSDHVFRSKRNSRTHCRRTLDFDFIHVNAVSVPLDLNLSLSLGTDNNRKKHGYGNLFDNKTIPNSLEVIDLDPSTECLSDLNAKDGPTVGCSAPVIADGVKSGSQVSTTSDPFTSVHNGKGLFCTASKSITSSEEGHSPQDRNSLIQGFSNSNCNLEHHVCSTTKQPCISSRIGCIDLNQVQPDDSCCFSNDPVVAILSATSSSIEFGESVGKMLGSFSPDVIHEKDFNISNHSFNTLKENNTRIDTSLKGSKINDHSLEVVVTDTTLVRICDDETNRIPGSTSMTCKRLSEDLRWLHDPNGKGGAEDNCSGHSDITVEGKHCDTTPASAKSCSVGDSDSSSTKTAWSSLGHQKSNKCGPDQLLMVHREPSQAVRISAGDQDRASTECIRSVDKCYNQMGEVDIFARTAAESLMNISVQNPGCCHHFPTPTPQPDKAKTEDELPLCSSDSFELFALRLAESNMEDSCVSSKPVKAIDSEGKDYGFNLRRGRRLKDFRKDVLPSIASLSRHEIWEDINILNGVLRSREYRKMRGKEAKVETWCIPVRSKRSRQQHVGRKNLK